MLVIASQSGHDLSRVIVLDLGDEMVSGGTAQRRRMATVVTDHHFVADDPVLEAIGRWTMTSSMPSRTLVRPQHDPGGRRRPNVRTALSTPWLEG
jgi:hypothetical protein